MTAPFPIDPQIIQQYLSLTRGVKNLDAPISEFLPSPTNNDYQKETIDRFFCRQTNQQNGLITEISSTDFSSISTHPFYISVSLTWKIAGKDSDILDPFGNIITLGLSNANKKAISIASKILPNLQFKLTNPYQFWLGH